MSLVVIESGRVRPAEEIECDSCHTTFLKRVDRIKEKNYCTRQCSSVSQRIRDKAECATCGDSFDRTPSKLKNSRSGVNFCSRKCKDIGQRICNGIVDIHPDHYGITDNYRNIAFRVFPRKCGHCSYDAHPELVEVHHIDSDRSNNDISNLAVLCTLCHRAITLKIATMGPDRILHWVK